MRVGLLQYKQGFTVSQFEEVFGKLESFLKKTNNDELYELYLPHLAIHPDDFEKMPIELFLNMPIVIDKTIGVGFTLEMVEWLKNNASFKNPDKGQYLIDKIGDHSLNLLIFEEEFKKKEEKSEFKMGRGSYEHIDHNMIKIEVSIDDMNPEFYGFLLGELLQLGANDVYIEPVYMKKNRPGNILHILCQEEKKEEIIAFLFRETTTLGIRYTPYSVYRLEREFILLVTPWGEATVKIGKMKGKVVQIAPEYDQCVNFAKQNNLPLKLVYDHIKGLGYQWLTKQN